VYDSFHTLSTLISVVLDRFFLFQLFASGVKTQSNLVRNPRVSHPAFGTLGSKAPVYSESDPLLYTKPEKRSLCMVSLSVKRIRVWLASPFSGHTEKVKTLAKLASGPEGKWDRQRVRPSPFPRNSISELLKTDASTIASL
jgi:hypothetical protein